MELHELADSVYFDCSKPRSGTEEWGCLLMSQLHNGKPDTCVGP